MRLSPSCIMVAAIGFATASIGRGAVSAGPAAPRALSEAQQIASAVLPLPAEFRAGAQVLGYRAGSAKLVQLRAGTGPFICLASDPAATQFHVACYHKSLEPFMARGRALREAGTAAAQVDTVRFAEAKSGKLVMPKLPAALYQSTGGTYDSVTKAIKGGMASTVIYVPGATVETTGITGKPGKPGEPWLMLPGTPKAHIMLVGSM